VIKQQLIRPNYQRLVSEIEAYFDASNVILQADRNTIKAVEFAGEMLVVKAYKYPHFLNRFIYTYFRKSKAWRAYEFGLKIAKFTPEVVARIEHYTPLLGKSYLICQQFEADFNMQAPLFKQHPDKENIFKQFALFVFELHQHQIIHQDLSPGNILIKKTPQNYQFQIIDINRMVFKKVSQQQAAQNFSKLWASDEDLRLILTTYAEAAQFDEDFINQGLNYNQQNKNRKTRKRKIKKILGLC
jgi:tRNA A-37 threonylcarbamoyl transferase component Bud32